MLCTTLIGCMAADHQTSTLANVVAEIGSGVEVKWQLDKVAQPPPGALASQALACAC
jgi:ornithine cyclodeaminase/alanine dehydrogenase-like protein (mu-crystallin family)